MQTLESYLSESLLKHLNIDYKLFESAGLYEGIEELCLFLTNKIKSHKETEFILTYSSDDRELRGMKNIFFDSITLRCERSNKYRNDAECVVNKAPDIDKDSLILKNCNIYVYLSQKHNSREIYTILLHELTHLWDNYKHIIKYGTSIEDVSNNYNEILRSLDNNSIIGKILYFINPIEVNAWLASFAGYLYDNLNDQIITDPKVALNVIKSSDLYKNYVNIGGWVSMIFKGDEKILSKNGIDIHKLCKEYNDIYGTNFTEHKVRKQIYNQYQKVRYKIESNIGKICTKYTKEFKLR